MRKTLLALLFSAVAACAAQQPWDPADLWKWRTASDPRIRPDGQWVVYVEGWSERAADASYSNLWAVSTDGKKRVRITDGEWRDCSPRWSPDGSRVAWIRERSGGVELRVGRLEARQQSPGESIIASGPVERLAWSPDGNSIAFTARAGWFVASVSGGAARHIQAGGLEAAGEPAWMPDGQSIVSAAADGEIYSIRVADGAARRLTNDAARNQDPVVSPDGARIAFLATDARPRSYSIRKLMVMNPDGTGAKVLGGALDRDSTGPQWSSDSRTVYFIADDRGSTHVYAGRNDGSTRQATSSAERLRGFTLADNGRAVSVRSTAAGAEEVVTFAVDVAPAPLVLAALNQALIAERQAGAAQEITFPSGGKTDRKSVV